MQFLLQMYAYGVYSTAKNETYSYSLLDLSSLTVEEYWLMCGVWLSSSFILLKKKHFTHLNNNIRADHPTKLEGDTTTFF